MNFQVNNEVKSATIQATIVRADGSVEPLGTIGFYHKNPLRRMAWALGLRAIAQSESAGLARDC